YYALLEEIPSVHPLQHSYTLIPYTTLFRSHISIEGDTDVAFTEDVIARYDAYGWHTQSVDWTAGGEYREDVDALAAAIEEAKKVTDRPSFIAQIGRAHV